jgi:hypothetical protein
MPQRKRIIRKLARTKRLEKTKREHHEWLKSKKLTPAELEKRTKESPVPFPEYKLKREMPKTSDKITKVSGRKEEQHYSGERKLLGIGMLHKSNLVPVFDQQDAIDISKMRRN